jgi:hypothetical protein
LTTLSPMRMSPAVISSSPAIMRRKVDLPQPEGPTSTHKLAVGDVYADTLDDVGAAKVLVYLTDGDAGHGKLRNQGAHWAQH